jgi:hypothetical protein
MTRAATIDRATREIAQVDIQQQLDNGTADGILSFAEITDS